MAQAIPAQRRSLNLPTRPSIDIDPHWYPGQPEVPADDQNQVPTVLTKLQKWGDYESIGEPLHPTRFIPMKTPLSISILDDWHLPQKPRYRLTVPDLLSHQNSKGRKVGLIMDLSNHECLYTEDLPADVQYRHIQLVAKELPPLEFVRSVAEAANAFWREHPDEYIAVHCAYGFNRTGFVVASYLIEECAMSVNDALDAFARSRPPGVKHEKFRDELHRRYSFDKRSRPLPIIGSLSWHSASTTFQETRMDDTCAPGSSPPGDDHPNGTSGSCIIADGDDNSSIGCSPDLAPDVGALYMGSALFKQGELNSRLAVCCSSTTSGELEPPVFSGLAHGHSPMSRLAFTGPVLGMTLSPQHNGFEPGAQGDAGKTLVEENESFGMLDPKVVQAALSGLKHVTQEEN